MEEVAEFCSGLRAHQADGAFGCGESGAARERDVTGSASTWMVSSEELPSENPTL